MHRLSSRQYTLLPETVQNIKILALSAGGVKGKKVRILSR